MQDQHPFQSDFSQQPLPPQADTHIMQAGSSFFFALFGFLAELLFYPFKVVFGMVLIVVRALSAGRYYLPVVLLFAITYSRVATGVHDFTKVRKCLIQKGAVGQPFEFTRRSLFVFSQFLYDGVTYSDFDWACEYRGMNDKQTQTHFAQYIFNHLYRIGDNELVVLYHNTVMNITGVSSWRLTSKLVRVPLDPPAVIKHLWRRSVFYNFVTPTHEEVLHHFDLEVLYTDNAPKRPHKKQSIVGKFFTFVGKVLKY